MSSQLKKIWPMLGVSMAWPLMSGVAEADNTEVQSARGSLETVTVTATRLPRPIEDIAGTVSVVTLDDIQQALSTNLGDAIRYQPGITMETARRGGNQGISIRGIGGNRVLTLVDGVRSSDIYAAGPSSYGSDAYDVDTLRSIEVVRGPASVLYGADAMGGAVVLTSKRPADYLRAGESTYWALRLDGDSAGDKTSLGLVGAGQWNDFGAIAQYTRRDFSERDIEGRDPLDPQDGNSDALLLKTYWDLSESHQLGLTVDAFNQEVETELKSELSQNISRSIGEDETERSRVSLTHRGEVDSAFLDHVESSLFWQKNDGLQHTDQNLISYSFLYSQTSLLGVPAFRETDFEFNQEVVGFNSMLTKELNLSRMKHSLVYGVNYERTDTERPRNRCETDRATGATTCAIRAFPFAPPEEFPNKTFPDTETTRTGLFAQNEIVLGESGVTIIPGIRYDRYQMEPVSQASLAIGADAIDLEEVEESHLSTNLGMIYDFMGDWSLFAQYAEGFRPPNYDESNQAFINYAFQYATIPNPNLNPETSRGIEVGVKANLPTAYIEISYFDNDYKDFIESQFFGMESGISLFQDRNIAAVNIKGYEARAHWTITPQWQLRVALAYAKGDNEIDNEPLNSIQPLTTVLGVRYSAERWNLEGVTNFVDNKDRVPPDQIEMQSYTTFDLLGALHITDDFNLRLGVLNLFDKEYATWNSHIGIGPNDERLATNEPGRTFRLSLNYIF